MNLSSHSIMPSLNHDPLSPSKNRPGHCRAAAVEFQHAASDNLYLSSFVTAVKVQLEVTGAVHGGAARPRTWCCTAYASGTSNGPQADDCGSLSAGTFEWTQSWRKLLFGGGGFTQRKFFWGLGGRWQSSNFFVFVRALCVWELLLRLFLCTQRYELS